MLPLVSSLLTGDYLQGPPTQGWIDNVRLEKYKYKYKKRPIQGWIDNLRQDQVKVQIQMKQQHLCCLATKLLSYTKRV